MWHFSAIINRYRNLQRQSAVARAVGLLVAAGILIPGCVSPMHTRFPVLQSFHPKAEGQAFQQQDPFMDPDIGPGDESRPRDFARPRTETRRAAEQRILQGLPSGPENSPSVYPRGGRRSSEAIY
ncbi:MAG: hypothetical protein KDA89_24210 [Planctomycetaceae bacterium]|nr:hypothetical protein [Planctomycetaceae bacterium]